MKNAVKHSAKNSMKRAVILLVLAGAGAWYVMQTPEPSGTTAELASSADEKEVSAALQASKPGEKSEAGRRQDSDSGASTATPPVSDQPSTPMELASLDGMTQTLSDFTRGEMTVKGLVEHLEKSRLEPTVTHDVNPDTGEMAIVRTQSPLPGTRYFHAQYFKDESDTSFVQHMSFEFKPSTSAMQDAIESVKKSFPGLATPMMQKDDFVQWDLDGQYIVWIKKMGPSDLQHDPFNAYTPNDVGTIRVAVEMEIHEN